MTRIAGWKSIREIGLIRVYIYSTRGDEERGALDAKKRGVVSFDKEEALIHFFSIYLRTAFVLRHVATLLLFRFLSLHTSLEKLSMENLR